MTDLGRVLLLVGALLAFFGLLLIFAGRANLPIGRLPGDLVYRGKNSVVYFPLMTSVLLSIVLSVVLYLVSRFGR